MPRRDQGDAHGVRRHAVRPPAGDQSLAQDHQIVPDLGHAPLGVEVDARLGGVEVQHAGLGTLAVHDPEQLVQVFQVRDQPGALGAQRQRLADRVDDRVIAGAAAVVARDVLADLLARRFRLVLHKIHRAHDHAGGAEPALDAAGLDRIARVASRRSYDHGATIFTEGEAPSFLVTIASGRVKVVKVNTLNVRGKFRRQRTKQAGQSTNWKKAIVTLKEGDRIDFFEGA